MSQNFELVSPERLQGTTDVNWNTCFICQIATEDENLISPINRIGFNPEKNSFHTVSVALKEFESIDGLPKNLHRRCKVFEDSKDLYNNFTKEKAVFHKSCISKFNKQKLGRKRKYFENEKRTASAENAVEENENYEVTPKRKAREQKQQFDKTCIFCERDDTTNLHQCQTLGLSNKIKKIAQELPDPNVLAKLSKGDLIATEAKYHLKCLTIFYNKYRDFNRKQLNTGNNFIEGIAFSELTTQIEELILTSNKTPVFMMKDLREMYQHKLRQLGATDTEIDLVNVTRLKESILAELPGLCEQKKGKYVLLALDESMGRAIFEASVSSFKDEGVIICKAASIVRKYMFLKEQSFDGNLSRARQQSSVAPQLIHLMGLILEGSKHYSTVTDSTNCMALNLAQLVQFNSIKTKRKTDSTNRRHSVSNEPPLPLLVGLSIHSKTRKKGVIKALSSQGLCVSYNRVLEIEDCITKQLCQKYNEDGIVCPPTLHNDLFTMAAIDNIDHNPSSSTAQTSYHGTSISIFQYADTLDEIVSNYQYETAGLSDQSKPKLPETYTNILPTNDLKPEPTSRKPYEIHPTFKETPSGISEWVESLGKSQLKDNAEKKLSFAAFHTDKLEPLMPQTFSTLLPLINESVNSTAMVRHCMKTIEELVQHLNPGQVTVITADQPVYALGNQVKWMYKEKFKNIIWMLGPLHIEMVLLSAIGDWLEGSGWVEVFEKAKITTTGRIESFLSGKKVKRTRYAHQLSLATLVKLSRAAFEDQHEISSFDEWKKHIIQNNINACYWFQVIELESLLFSFIKSLRDADFAFFVKCLNDITPWMFALDHTHYARWLPIFIRTLQQIPLDHPSIFEAFKKGYFTVKNSQRRFSNIGVDQAHEQNNKLVKIDGGAIGILDNPNTLLRWAVAGPVLAEICKEDVNDTTRNHHEDTKSFEKQFHGDLNSLYTAFTEIGNPFKEEENGLVHLTSKVVVGSATSDSVRNARKIGEDQFQSFVDERLHSEKVSFYNNIKQTNLPLFRQKNAVVTSKSKQKIMSLNADRRLYSQLYIACQSRKGDLESFFSHENHSYPVSISEYGKLRKCNSKSDFLRCITDLMEASLEPPVVEMKVFDGAAFVNMNPPRNSTTFGEYITELRQKVERISHDLQRLDMVFDVYKPDSLKTQTRDNRGIGTRVSVREDTPLLKNFNMFMRNDANKTELFQKLASSFTSLVQPAIIATSLDHVISNSEIDISSIEPCNHEEADTRLIIHVKHGANRHKKISIVTVDTDVVVIALYHFFSLDLDELWIEFGVGKNKRYLPIHDYASLLKEEICRALPFWFTVTGCDTVSMFAGRGKKTAWQVWGSCPSLTKAFVSLSSTEILRDDNFSMIERFVALLYDRASACTEVNECRRILFTKKQRSVEAIPPTQDALRQHVLRAMMQSSIWCRADEKLIPDFDPNVWGWKKVENGFTPLWMTKEEASVACKELVRCGCKKKCGKRCKCMKFDMTCTELCGCGGGC